MPKAAPLAQPAATPTRPSVKRSVWGCLTCRRRKVKCQSRDTPCAACSRLQLACVPSFNGNFKLWKREHREEYREEHRWETPKETPGNALGFPSPEMRMPGTVHESSPDEPSADSLNAFLALHTGDHQRGGDWHIAGGPSPWEHLDMPFLFGATGDGTCAYTSPDLYAPPSFFTDDGEVLQQLDQASVSLGFGTATAFSEPVRTPVSPSGLVTTPARTDDGFFFSGLGATLQEPPSTALCLVNEDHDSNDNRQSGNTPIAWPAHLADPFNNLFSCLPSPLADSDNDRSLVVYYKRNLSSFFSVKSAVLPYSSSSIDSGSASASFSSPSSADVTPWNFYSYAIRAAERHPDSPLRHSILAWTSAHLILRKQAAAADDNDHAALQFRHYARARAAADRLREELKRPRGSRDLTTSNLLTPSCTPSPSSPYLRMLLATTLFLAYGDILSGDSAGLVHALTGITQLLASDWPRFRAALGPVEARILVWLAYLDLRSNLWTAKRGKGSGSSSSGSSSSRSLFHFLQDHAGTTATATSGISALRGQHTPHRHYYLAECFGAALPARELADDLLQEPAKMLSDEIMGVYAAISDLEGWIEGLWGDQGAWGGAGADANADANADALRFEDTSGIDTLASSFPTGGDDRRLLLELRTAKVQALRANIARIHAECKVVHAELLRASSGADHVARTAFHRRVTTAMCLAATILLNRVDAPHVRTDDEAQAAAHEIVQIAREMRSGGGSLCEGSASIKSSSFEGRSFGSPRSLVWPMPLFVAGIEVADPVYQDWVLGYMQDVASWGTSTKRARELLRRIMERQDALGRRVKVRDVLGEFGDSILI